MLPATVILLLLMAVVQTMDVMRNWQSARGHEHARIAENLALGHGFSFHESRRWLYERGKGDGYQPTAWVGPVYPYLLATLFRLFGESGKLVMLILHVAAFALTGMLVFSLASRLRDPLAGGLATGIFVFVLEYQLRHVRWIESVHQLLSNNAVAGLLVVACVLGLARLIERPTVPMTIGCGLLLGLTALTAGSTLLFTPAALIAILSANELSWHRRLGTAIILVLVAGATVAPWAARNHAQFGYWVPVRNGGGQIIHTGNPALAATFSPDSVKGAVSMPPPWSAANAREALRLVRETGNRRSLEKYQRQLVESQASTDYATYNETERDREYLRQAKSFIFQNPLLAGQITLEKALAFGFKNWPVPGILAVLSIAGMVFLWRNSRGRLLTFLALAYSLPYVLTLPVLYRYRYPVDPLLAVLVGILVSWFVSQIFGRENTTSASRHPTI